MATADKYKEYKSIDDLPATCRVSDIAEFLGINSTKAYELFNRSDFPSMKLGQRWIVPKRAFSNWLDQQTDQEGVKK